jgi:hypothetical protein
MNIKFPALMAVLPLGLCSCGVYQVATARDEDERDSTAVIMAIAPVLLITGDYPDTTANNFKPFSYYAELIRQRNAFVPTTQETNEMLAAMDRCFRMPNVKRMSERELDLNFGPADRKMTHAGSLVYVYEITRAPGRPERWLVHD